MKVTEEHSEPEHVKDRQPYRVRIDGKHGDAIEVVEQMGGGFLIISVTRLPRFDARLTIAPVDPASVIVHAK